jgi:pimeloyl-ACP methyl ester carboxylesterase
MVEGDEAAQEAFIQHRGNLSDGRRMVCAEYGTRGDLPSIYLHGFLGSRLEPLAGLPSDVNIIAPDRPGYGGTALPAEPSFLGFGRDLEELLGNLGIDRCSIVGVSAGGPFAIGAAVVLGDRVRRCILAGAVANKRVIREGGGSIRAFRRLRRHVAIVQAVMPRLFRNARQHGLDLRLVRMMLKGEDSSFGPNVDRGAVTRALVASLREGTRGGVAGALSDIMLLTRKWDASPRAVSVPSLVLHGAADRVVPTKHAFWYGERLHDAQFEIVPGAGHISLVVNEADRIVRAALALA